jgi:hypothetical protein
MVYTKIGPYNPSVILFTFWVMLKVICTMMIPKLQMICGIASRMTCYAVVIRYFFYEMIHSASVAFKIYYMVKK